MWGIDDLCKDVLSVILGKMFRIKMQLIILVFMYRNSPDFIELCPRLLTT